MKTFNPKKLDCEQWAKTLVAAGMKGVIITAKHHDGFCLWPTHTTDYCIRNTPYKNGEGDIVGELSKACEKYGLKFGVSSANSLNFLSKFIEFTFLSAIFSSDS